MADTCLLNTDALMKKCRAVAAKLSVSARYTNSRRRSMFTLSPPAPILAPFTGEAKGDESASICASAG